MARGPWRSFMPPSQNAVASPNALRSPKHTKKKPARPRSSIQTSQKTLEKLSATASRGTRQRGNNARLECHSCCRPRGHTVREILEQLKAVQGEIGIGVSVVTIVELVHGAYRTKTQVQQQRRLEFVERLSSDRPVHPVTLANARLPGRIEGQQETIGVQFAFEDLLIARQRRISATKSRR
jgi:predicted nucleic acid-binding protein